MDCHDIQLKEASVVLTKLDDKLFFKESKFVSSEDGKIRAESFSPSDKMKTEENSSVSVIQESRKRKRKSTVPQRKIKRIDEFFYDNTFDNLSPTWGSVHSIQNDDESGIDISYQNSCLPSALFTRKNTPDDLNMSANDLQDVNCKKEKSDKLKLTQTPIFVKKSKPSTGTKILKQPTDESCSTPNKFGDPNKGKIAICSSNISSDKLFGSHGKTDRISSIAKRGQERKAPNILSRTSRLQNKSSSSKSNVSSEQRSHTPVEIRPKSRNTEISNLKTSARTAFAETLHKQIKSPFKNAVTEPSYPETQNERAEKHVISKSSDPEFVVNHVACPSSTNSGIKSLITQEHSKIQKDHVISSASAPLTINQSASSCEVSTAIKPPASRPHYSSRLRSKSGTKYIVRKDSIITADIKDIFEAKSGQRLSPACEGKLIVKIPERCLNGKKFYNNFVKKSNPSVVDNVADDKMPGPSGINSQVHTESVKPNFLIGQNSPVFKYTHNKSESKSTKEGSFMLYSRGRLGDNKREMNIVTPDIWNTPNRQTIPESLQTISAEIKTSTQVPPRYESIKERYQAYLHDKKLNDTGISKANSKSSSNLGQIENKIVQSTKEQDLWYAVRKLQSNDDLTRIDKDTILQNKSENDEKSYEKLHKMGNKRLHRRSSEIYKCTSLKHGLQDERFIDTPKGNSPVQNKEMKQDNGGKNNLKNEDIKTHRESYNKSFKVEQIKQEPKDEPLNIIHSIEEFKQKCRIKQEPSETNITCENRTQSVPDEHFLFPTKAKGENLKKNNHINRDITEITVKQEQSLNDHAYTLSEKLVAKSSQGPQNIPTVVKELQAAEVKFDKTKSSPQKQAPIPVFAVRCGEKVVLFPASNAISVGKVKTTNMVANSSTVQSQKKFSPSKTAKCISSNKILLKKPEKQQTDFAKKCGLNFTSEPICKKPEIVINNLVTTDFKTVMNKRPRNHMKHMCAVVVQITRSENNIFSFSKDILALSFTNGSNPSLVRWHQDGIHVAMVTFNNQSRIQHLTVDFITAGFYTLNLRNDQGVRKSRTFEGLLTSTLPNEDLLHSEKDFIAIGQIKHIMDPTISKSSIKNGPDMTLTDALSDVLPSNLAQVYNPSVSDRSYRPKYDDKNWYSNDKFEIFTNMYGRTRAYQPNGCRLHGEEVR